MRLLCQLYRCFVAQTLIIQSQDTPFSRLVRIVNISYINWWNTVQPKQRVKMKEFFIPELRLSPQPLYSQTLSYCGIMVILSNQKNIKSGKKYISYFITQSQSKLPTYFFCLVYFPLLSWPSWACISSGEEGLHDIDLTFLQNH